MGIIKSLSKRKEGDVWKGVAAGAMAGVVAAWVMNQFQSLLSRESHGVERSHGAQSVQQGSPKADVTDSSDDDATERLAEGISENVFNRELTEGEKYRAGTAVHYAFGAVTGGLYGAAAEVLPGVTSGTGAPFGAAVWLAADEGIVPALGLSKPPTEYPLSIHAYSIASHVVYGLTTELVRRAIRRTI